MKSTVNRRTFIKQLSAASLAFPMLSFSQALEKKPNIVFIYCDDIGWTDLGCYGSGFYETPNIDKLCNDGIKFTDAYSCAPICAPARSTVISGQYTPRTEVYYITNVVETKNAAKAVKLITEPFTPNLSLDKISIAQALKSAGYATAHFGKWHLGEYPDYHPSQFGFDEAIESMNTHWDFTTLPPMDIPKGVYLSDFMCDHALAFMEKNTAEEKPFFLYLPDYLAHKPMEAKQERIDYFKNKPSVGGHHEPTYAAMIYHLDETVGRIMNKVEELGIAENTLIVFASDNGGRAVFKDNGELKSNSKTDNSPLRGGKAEIYEGGIRVPMICKWPGKITPGSICDEPVTSVDFYTTFLKVAGADVPDNYILDGTSFLSCLYDPNVSLDRDAIYWYIPYYSWPHGSGAECIFYNQPCAAIRSGDHKLIEFFEDGSVELYNIKEDIGESYDLSLDEPEKVVELQGKLAQWLKDVNAPVMEINPGYDPPVPESEKNSVKNNRFENGLQYWSFEVNGTAQASISETGKMPARTGLNAAQVTVTEAGEYESVALVSDKITGDVDGKKMDISCFVKSKAGKVFRTFQIQARFFDENGNVSTETSFPLDLVKVYKDYEFSLTIPNYAVAVEVCLLFGKYSGMYFVDDIYAHIPGVVTTISEIASSQNTKFEINLYPNPAHESIFIDSDTPIKSIRLFNVLGQTVRSYNMHKVQIPVYNLPSGVYFIQVKNWSDQIKLKKVRILH